MCNLEWEDEIPSNLREVWLSDFKTMKDIGEIRFHRAVVPSDAVNLNIETIETADASNDLICCAIYARFERKGGKFSCQLIFARTKIVPADLTIPRAELMAATLNAVTGHEVKLSLGDRLKRSWKITDSQVVLHWICSFRAALKLWVRNRVIEINRLTDLLRWFYNGSKMNPSDIGTRKGVKVSDIGPESIWICGHEWMRWPDGKFPLKTAKELILSAAELQEVKKECTNDIATRVDLSCNFGTRLEFLEPVELEDLGNDSENHMYSIHFSARQDYQERYGYSEYVIDPLKFRFRKVVRILALVFLFISKTRAKVSKALVNTHKLAPVPDLFRNDKDKYVVTTGRQKSPNWRCPIGLL